MNQPDLGKKIAELRKAKGLTQEELVDKCKLSVRTLQRIEAGEVTPRSYTVRTIFAVLDYNLSDSSETAQNRPTDTGSASLWPEQFYRYVFDLFNLKTNTMKKISILSIAIIALSAVFVIINSDSEAQTPAKIKKTIEASSKKFVQWFNNGQVDSLMTLYKDDACIVSGCDKTFIKEYYASAVTQFKFKDFTVADITISDSLAVEKGRWSAILLSGEQVGGEYLTEWRFTNNRWLIVKDMVSVNDPN